LIQPVQRVPRYEMLLMDLAKNTWDTHTDLEQLKVALQNIKELATHINTQKKVFEEAQRMLEIQNKIGIKYELIQPDRHICLDINVSLFKSEKKREEVHCLLMDDAIIFWEDQDKTLLNKKLAKVVMFELLKDLHLPDSTGKEITLVLAAHEKTHYIFTMCEKSPCTQESFVTLFKKLQHDSQNKFILSRGQSKVEMAKEQEKKPDKATEKEEKPEKPKKPDNQFSLSPRKGLFQKTSKHPESSEKETPSSPKEKKKDDLKNSDKEPPKEQKSLFGKKEKEDPKKGEPEAPQSPKEQRNSPFMFGKKEKEDPKKTETDPPEKEQKNSPSLFGKKEKEDPKKAETEPAPPKEPKTISLFGKKEKGDPKKAEPESLQSPKEQKNSPLTFGKKEKEDPKKAESEPQSPKEQRNSPFMFGKKEKEDPKKTEPEPPKEQKKLTFYVWQERKRRAQKN